MLGGDALDRHRHDLPGALLALLAGLLLDLAHRAHRVALGLVHDLLGQGVLRLLDRHLRDALELPARLGPGPVDVLTHRLELAGDPLEILLALVGVREAALGLVLPLGQAILVPAELLAPDPEVLLGLLAHARDLVADLRERVPDLGLGLVLGVRDELRRPDLGGVDALGHEHAPSDEPDDHPHDQSDHRRHDRHAHRPRLPFISKRKAEQKAGSASLGFERKAGDARPAAGSTYTLV